MVSLEESLFKRKKTLIQEEKEINAIDYLKQKEEEEQEEEELSPVNNEKTQGLKNDPKENELKLNKLNKKNSVDTQASPHRLLKKSSGSMILAKKTEKFSRSDYLSRLEIGDLRDQNDINNQKFMAFDGFKGPTCKIILYNNN